MEKLHPNSEKLILEARDDNTSPKRLTELARISPTLTRLVAANPNTNPELLAELARDDDDEIRRAVAANPNTPTEVLFWELGEDFPEELLDNPVFSLLLIENPNLVETIPEYTLRALLLLPAPPMSFMEWVADNGTEYLKSALTMNSKTPRALLEKLLINGDAGVREAARLHVNFSEQIPEDLEAVIGEPIKAILFGDRDLDLDRGDWEFLVEIGIIPPAFLELMANHEKEKYRCGVAASYLASEGHLEKLARDLNWEVVAKVASNPQTPVKLLEQLAENEDLHVRMSLAENPNAPVWVLEKLGRDRPKDEKLAKALVRGVRDAVARNPNTPVDLLEELAIDAEIPLAVAKNPRAPSYLLERMARYKLQRYQELRQLLAINPNTPSHLLEKLSLDIQAFVRSQVTKNPNTPGSLLEKLGCSHSYRIRQAVAGNPNAPANTLVGLAEEKIFPIRSAVAANPNTPINILEQLARDPDCRIRAVVASHPTIPVPILEELGRDEYGVVHQQVAANPKTPLYLREQFLSELIPPTKIFQQKALKLFLAEKPDALPQVLKLLADNMEFFRGSSFFVFLHWAAPTGVLAANCQSFAWRERFAIAQNPNTPTDTLQILANDGNRIVRAAAKVNLGDRLPT